MFTPSKIEGALERLFDLFDADVMAELYENHGEEIEDISPKWLAKAFKEQADMLYEFRAVCRVGDGINYHGKVLFNQRAVNLLSYLENVIENERLRIHNYFFAKTLDQVRPGGVVAFVTSRHSMDSKTPDARKYVAQRADFLGAIRLPNNAFKKNAGTDVVSDIIFLQKRDHPIDIDQDWVHLNTTPDGFTMNSYFVDHPEMVLGELAMESTQYGKDDLTVRPITDADLAEQLKEAIAHIGGVYQPVELAETEHGTQEDVIPADPNVKNFSYAVVDGEVYFRENSVMRHLDLNEKAKERVTGMVELRRIVNELIEFQLEDFPDEMISQKQQELNEAYDAFTAKHGLINNRANGQAFSDDSSYYLLCSLENVDEDGNLKSKADMFTKRTIKPERRVTSVDTPSEALAISIGERGRVDLDYMAELLGTPGE